MTLAGAVLVGLAAGCSGDGGALSTIPTLPPTSPPSMSAGSTPGSEVTTSDPAESSAPASDAATSTPVAPTTTSLLPAEELEQLRRDVEGDFLRNRDLLFSIVRRPTSKDLAARVRQAVAPGSEFFDSLMKNYRDMIAKGQRIQLGDPPLLKQTVERVEFSGDAPYTEAIVTYCEVSNGNLVAVARNGEITNVGPPQGVAASRVVVAMRLTDDGWKEYKVVDSTVGYWEGARSCPEA